MVSCRRITAAWVPSPVKHVKIYQIETNITVLGSIATFREFPRPVKTVRSEPNYFRCIAISLAYISISTQGLRSCLHSADQVVASLESNHPGPRAVHLRDHFSKFGQMRLNAGSLEAAIQIGTVTVFMLSVGRTNSKEHYSILSGRPSPFENC